ncbi:MAG: radical SAM protein [Deltaproteobacteria bacterium]|nr:radical SAM protein [Deltaproteobacteria bacterium]
MSRKKQLIIPIFIPFGGCPHKCAFCDQEGITGNISLPGLTDVTATIEAYLSTWKGAGLKEVAFYGGSFTGLPLATQKSYLEAAYWYVLSGEIDSLRVSTRPDYIGQEVVALLKEFKVATVELGVQSMSDEVLALSVRGHSSRETVKAVGILKEAGIKTGLQFMPGLPGDTTETVISTTESIIGLKPAFVRIYPALVLKNTALHRMYLNNEYRPWPLDEMVSVCRKAVQLFKDAGIPVIRIGLQPTAELEKNIAAGPYHPSFRQLVEKG